MHRSPCRLWWLIFRLLVLFMANQSSLRADQPYIVDANPALLKLLRIEEVRPRDLAESLRLSARVELDQQKVARIGASVTGRVTEINAELGQVVKKHERLAMLSSSELGKAQSDYLKATSQFNLQKLAV